MRWLWTLRALRQSINQSTGEDRSVITNCWFSARSGQSVHRPAGISGPAPYEVGNYAHPRNLTSFAARLVPVANCVLLLQNQQNLRFKIRAGVRVIVLGLGQLKQRREGRWPDSADALISQTVICVADWRNSVLAPPVRRSGRPTERETAVVGERTKTVVVSRVSMCGGQSN